MRRRLTRRGKRNRQKKIIVTCFLCLLLCLCVGYAAFNTELSLRAKGNIIESENCEFGGIKVNTVTDGDGLYKDTYEEGKCTYKGANPNNYIIFNNEMWRILSTEQDGTIKIIRNGSNDILKSQAFDTTNNHDWMRPATINTYLNTEYLSSINTNKDKIVTHDYGVGPIEGANDHSLNKDLAKQIIDEKSKIWNGKIALITVSEYIRANSNINLCGNFYLVNAEAVDAKDSSICKDTNWIYSLGSGDSDFIRTLTPISETELDFITYPGRNDYKTFVFNINHRIPYLGAITVAYMEINIGSFMTWLYDFPVNKSGVSIIPTLYLTSDIVLNGTGTEQDPFQIIN